MYKSLVFTDANSVICKMIVGTPVLGCPRTPQERCPYKHKPTIMNVGDDLGRIVIPKEIRRTLKIREGDPSHTTLTLFDRFCWAIHSVVERAKAR